MSSKFKVGDILLRELTPEVYREWTVERIIDGTGGYYYYDLYCLEIDVHSNGLSENHVVETTVACEPAGEFKFSDYWKIVSVPIQL